MSVEGVQTSRAGWKSLWPLWALLVLLLAGAGAVWWYWPQLLWHSVNWQRSLHQELVGILQRVAEQPRQAGIALLGFSLLYGILHALGPGHGKVVIATFLATHPTRLKTSLQLTLAAAVVQGLVAVALVTLMLVVLQTTSRQLHLSSFWLEKGSYLLVIGLGGWLCWRALRQLMRLRPADGAAPPGYQLHSAGHQHHAHCGCGHQHLPDNRQLARATGWKTSLLLVLSMGMRPCSGAIMMLLFARVIGVYGWGVASALAMALGTALTVSAMALLVQSSRALALRLNRRAAPALWQRVALHSLALAGGTLLMVGGVILWLSAQPVVSGGLRALG
ncbi:nickel/cobalt transporter [Mixta tenebrionis]|uniref:Nickel/cobalt efflux system n=1 Tax=Mixta tenebrionis TaxID=2562439 RepID=A0A506V9Z9_9GAMM|nr:nickel/cobalt transporter [Mixta tenebrionis]TPW42342.1 nickel/cobalt transporter [Mixta tenebrionis]